MLYEMLVAGQYIGGLDQPEQRVETKWKRDASALEQPEDGHDEACWNGQVQGRGGVRHGRVILRLDGLGGQCGGGGAQPAPERQLGARIDHLHDQHRGHQIPVPRRGRVDEFLKAQLPCAAQHCRDMPMRQAAGVSNASARSRAADRLLSAPARPPCSGRRARLAGVRTHTTRSQRLAGSGHPKKGETSGRGLTGPERRCVRRSPPLVRVVSSPAAA